MLGRCGILSKRYDPYGDEGGRVRIRSILAGSRFFIALAAIGTFLTSAAVLLYGVIAALHVIWTAFDHSKFTPASAKTLAIECIELIDLFLLGTVLYIVALGL